MADPRHILHREPLAARILDRLERLHLDALLFCHRADRIVQRVARQFARTCALFDLADHYVVQELQRPGLGLFLLVLARVDVALRPDGLHLVSLDQRLAEFVRRVDRKPDLLGKLQRQFLRNGTVHLAECRLVQRHDADAPAAQ